MRTSVRTWGKIEDIVAFAAEPAYYHNRDADDTTFDEAYFTFSVKNFSVSVGRQSLWWGAGFHGNLLLTDNAAPLDMVKIGTWQPLSLPKIDADVSVVYFLAKLKRNRIVSEAKLHGVRFSLALQKNIVVSASRLVMMGGDRGGRALGIDDLVKSMVDGNYNTQREQNNNQMTGFDFVYRMPQLPPNPIFQNLLFYGEAAFDGEEDSGFSNPATLFGIYTVDILRHMGLSLRMEYASTDSNAAHEWYTHNLYGTGWTHKGHMLGHHMGGDADDLYIALGKDGLWEGKVDMRLDYDKERRGISSANTERRERFGIHFSFFRTEIVQCELGYIFEHIENYSNQPKRDVNNHIVELVGKAEF